MSLSPEKINDSKQDKLNDATYDTIFKNGGINYLQAEYFSELSNYVTSSKKNIFINLQPQIDMSSKQESYSKALSICVAYLHRYNMAMTFSTMKTELSDTPSQSYIKKGSDLDAMFNSLIHHLPPPTLSSPKKVKSKKAVKSIKKRKP